MSVQKNEYDWTSGFARHEDEDEREARLKEEHLHRLRLREFSEALIASEKAIAAYRWWHLGSLVLSFKQFVVGLKYRLGVKLWP